MLINLTLQNYVEANIYCAKIGVEALEILQKLKNAKKYPHIVFTDFRMPGLDGIELLQQISSNFSQEWTRMVKIILTGISHSTEKTKLIKQASNLDVPVIYKPFNYKEVIKCAEKQLLEYILSELP